MVQKGNQSFTVRYDQGMYEISMENTIEASMLYYDRDPDGSNLTYACTANGPHITFQSPIPGERLYFFLKLKEGSTLTAASRGVEIGGVENFRDLGGYRTADGRTVKWGRFFRGGPLHGLTDGQKAALKAMKLKRVVDYRTHLEAGHVPDECPDGAECLNVPAMPQDMLFQDFANLDMLSRLRQIGTAREAEAAFGVFVQFYGALPFCSGPYLNMLSSLDSEETYPMYQHCSAGKDRTGIGSLLLLLALGVPEKAAVDDYLLSQEFRREGNRRYVERMAAGGISKAAEALAARMMNVTEELVRSALNAILSKYPSYDAFFEGEYGITMERLVRWRGMHTC